MDSELSPCPTKQKSERPLVSVTRGRLLRIAKILVVAGLIYYVFSGIDTTIFLRNLRELSPFAIVILAFYETIGYVVNAWRWQFLSRHRCSFPAAFESFIVSTFLNDVLPARLGELARVYYLSMVHGVRSSRGFSILILERFFDLILLGALTFITLLFQINLPGTTPAALAVTTLMVGVIFTLRRHKRFFIWLATFIPGRRVKVYAKMIIIEMHRTLTPGRIVGTLLYTLLVWTIHFSITAFFLIFAANIALPPSGYFVVFVVSALAMSIPLAPAAVGTYHAGLVLALGLYDVVKSEALAIAIVLHIVQIIPPALIAMWILARREIPIYGLTNKQVQPID